MNSRNYPPVIAIVGPTGSGKSELAIKLAQRLNGEIVNCDSVQVYRGLDIGSAKSPATERAGIPHHVIDVVPFTDELTAGSYARLARAAIRDIHGRQKLPIVAGGTGFYLRALFEGLSPAPTRDAAFRTRLQAAQVRFPGILQRWLKRIDPVSAARIHGNDIPKLIRALEISRLARQPASAAQNEPRDAFTGIQLLKVGLQPERSELIARLNARVDKMFEAGLIDETRNLLAEIQSSTIPRSLLSLGYRQAVDFLQGRRTVPEAIEQTKIKTRQYAKRQLTWFRADPAIRWIPEFGFHPEAVQRALEWGAEFTGRSMNCKERRP